MELEMLCDFKNIEIRNSKTGDRIYYYLTVIQKGRELHLCIFDDKAFTIEVDKLKTLPSGSQLKLVCNYNYRNNRANLNVVGVDLSKNN